MRNLDADIAYEVALDKAFEDACNAGAELEKQEIRNQHKEYMQEVTEEGNMYRYLLGCYRNAKRYENELLEIDDAFVDAPKLVEALKKYGVEKFAFTSTWSGSIEVALELQKNGCVLLGLGDVNSDKMFGSTEYSKKAAIFFSVCK